LNEGNAARHQPVAVRGISCLEFNIVAGFDIHDGPAAAHGPDKAWSALQPARLETAVLSLVRVCARRTQTLT